MKKFTIEANRLESMLELAGVMDQKSEAIQKMFSQIGLERTIEKLNKNFDTNLRMGSYIIQSKLEKGFWSNDFGWCYNKDGATGYSQNDVESYRDASGNIKLNFFETDDASFIEYKKAIDF